MHDVAVFFTEYDNDRFEVSGTKRWRQAYHIEPIFCVYYDIING